MLALHIVLLNLFLNISYFNVILNIIADSDVQWLMPFVATLNWLNVLILHYSHLPAQMKHSTTNKSWSPAIIHKALTAVVLSVYNKAYLLISIQFFIMPLSFWYFFAIEFHILTYIL